MRHAAWIVLAMVGCHRTPGQPTDASIDASADASPDAYAGYCVSSTDCSDPAFGPVCCLICSPGGACYPMCGNAGGAFCGYAACDPAVAPCTRADGSLGTCTTFQPPPSYVTYYRCE